MFSGAQVFVRVQFEHCRIYTLKDAFMKITLLIVVLEKEIVKILTFVEVHLPNFAICFNNTSLNQYTICIILLKNYFKTQNYQSLNNVNLSNLTLNLKFNAEKLIGESD